MDTAIGDEHRVEDLDKPRPKVKRGYKECHSCLLRLHISIKRCVCGHIFVPKKKVPVKYRSFQEIEWTALSIGSIIYIDSQDIWVDENNVVEMGESGEFTVKEVLGSGLLLFGKSGYLYQEMVKFGLHKNTGILKKKPLIYTFIRKRD